MEGHVAEDREFGEQRFLQAEYERDDGDIECADGVKQSPEVQTLEMERMFGNMVDGVTGLDPGDGLQAEDDFRGGPEIGTAEEQASDKAQRVPVDADEHQLVDGLGKLPDSGLFPQDVGEEEREQ